MNRTQKINRVDTAATASRSPQTRQRHPQNNANGGSGQKERRKGREEGEKEREGGSRYVLSSADLELVHALPAPSSASPHHRPHTSQPCQQRPPPDSIAARPERAHKANASGTCRRPNANSGETDSMTASNAVLPEMNGASVGNRSAPRLRRSGRRAAKADPGQAVSLGSRAQGQCSGVHGRPGPRISGLGSRFQGLGSRVWGLGARG
eukprot:2321553-Rhodomonas_salina.1